MIGVRRLMYTRVGKKCSEYVIIGFSKQIVNNNNRSGLPDIPWARRAIRPIPPAKPNWLSQAF